MWVGHQQRHPVEGSRLQVLSNRRQLREVVRPDRHRVNGREPGRTTRAVTAICLATISRRPGRGRMSCSLGPYRWPRSFGRLRSSPDRSATSLDVPECAQGETPPSPGCEGLVDEGGWLWQRFAADWTRAHQVPPDFRPPLCARCCHEVLAGKRDSRCGPPRVMSPAPGIVFASHPAMARDGGRDETRWLGEVVQ